MLPTKDQIQAAYQNAPDYVRDFIVSSELDEMFSDIRTKHKLHLDDAGRLSVAINAIALELAPLDTFPALVKEALTDISGEVQGAVTAEVNDRIFKELREWARLDKEGLLYEPETAPSPEPEATAIEAAATAPADTAQKPVDKLSEAVRQAPEEREAILDDQDGQPPQPAPQQTPQKEKSYPGSDPYREPIE